MMSGKGMTVLSEMYNIFREEFVEDNLGCNANDVERRCQLKHVCGVTS